ncbi:MAG TPA: hypothetical protein VKA10_06980 [Prolixibacteraceae bacterium]|nr:hypothetical protein [Prolixibacteraceae bacterium]
MFFTYVEDTTILRDFSNRFKRAGVCKFAFCANYNAAFTDVAIDVVGLPINFGIFGVSFLNSENKLPGDLPGNS